MAKAKDNHTDSNGAMAKSPKGVFQTAKQTVTHFLDDTCLNLAAAIAYYALQSIIPLILGFIVLGSLFLQDRTTRQDFITGVENAIPKDVGQSINFTDLINGLINGAGAAGIISILTLLWTGSGIFDQLIFAINRAYNIQKDKRNFFFKLFLRISLLLGLGGLFAVAFIITIAVNLIFGIDINIFGVSPKTFIFLQPILANVIPFLLEVVIFAILYRVSPARKGLRWRPVFIGGTVAAILFELLKVAFSYYITAFGAASNAAKTYGAIGGIIVFLFFIYLSAAVILFGAELSAVLHNFKGGIDSTENASKQDNTVIAKSAQDPAEKTVPGSGPSIQASLTKLDKNNPLAIFTGAITLLFVVAVSTVFRRKGPMA
jgi:membrane protein